MSSGLSASGLRPTSAFVVIGVVVVLVALRIGFVTSARGSRQPDRTKDETSVPPAYSIEGAGGETLARFVPRFDLVLSPRSMWQAHTPRYMSELIAELLEEQVDADELCARFVPDATDGVIAVEAWELTPRQANALREWKASGSGTDKGTLGGVWIEPLRTAAKPRFRLYWNPAHLLSRKVRQAHGYSSAWAWARRLADGIDSALQPPRAEPELLTPDERQARRAAVWSAMIPTAFTRAVRGIPPHRVLEVRELLQAEAVAPWQMWIAYERDRRYPAGEHELFGTWGFTHPDQHEPEPRSGLELLCDQLLDRAEWSFLDAEPAVYTWEKDRTIRGDRADGFLSFTSASRPPTVRASLDLTLQRFLRQELEVVMEEHRPALAQAIVIEVESGRVLAVDSVEEYTIQPFAPVFHPFTPGSSMKVVTMAIALEAGVVRPETVFEVGSGELLLTLPEGGSRLIHEAEGHITGRKTAAWCLAGSSNAGLAQIGMRVEASAYHAQLTRLGYGQKPRSGLGSEQRGYLAELPWTPLWTQASVAFGHELTTTLWQHASALATILRGGVFLPLQLLDSVRCGNDGYRVGLAPGERIFSERTSAEVRDMMRLGAREGTGDSVYRDDIDMGTKTGTAEKVPDEMCLHIELRERQRCFESGRPFTNELRRDLRSHPKPHKTCYTSSMCIFGSLPGGRELMVFVVVDEPRGKERFGSRVAGPAAAAILNEALGFTRNGREPELDLVEGFATSDAILRNELDEPWRAPW